jgi:acetoin utilization deacetylase AcuC-like enzyme
MVRMGVTAILSDTRFDLHTWPGHVEQAARLQAVHAAIAEANLLVRLQQLTSVPAPLPSIEAVHTPQLLRAVRQLAGYGGGQLDMDTYVTADSWELATLAAGAVLGATQAVLDARAANAFALVRPPGHHATPGRAMGFCLINHVAVAARFAVREAGLTRVAVVDYDVHHGNGTQDIFYDDPQILMLSTHAAPFYPGTGAHTEQGGPTAPGATLNVPLPFGVGDTGYAMVFEQVVAPALRRFQPELILVSAGYDAHWSDPLGPMLLSVGGFAQLNRRLLDLADELCGGRIVFSLEGGYNLNALGACAVATLRQLLGDDPGPDLLGAVAVREPVAEVQRMIDELRVQHPLVKH